MTTIKDELSGRVDTVARKVQPLDILNSTMNQSAQDIKAQLSREIKESQRRVASELTACKQKLESISTSLEKPSSKGTRAERKVIDVLNEHLPSFSCVDTSSKTRKGNIGIQTPSNHSIMIEMKNKKTSVPKNEIELFEENLAKSPQFKVGILLSMASGIARRAREGRFEVAVNPQKQYQTLRAKRIRVQRGPSDSVECDNGRTASKPRGRLGWNEDSGTHPDLQQI